jgi:hypothetical protein
MGIDWLHAFALKKPLVGVICGRGRDSTLSGPVVLAGQRDVLPAQGRDMGKQVRWWSFTGLGHPGDDLPELPGVPGDDDGGAEGQAGDPVVLRLV